MKAQAAIVFAGLQLLGLAGCVAPVDEASRPPPMPPPWAEQDRTAYNNQQVALFLERDPGWQAWLNAILSSAQASDALADTSRYNTPVWEIIREITDAQDAYRAATSYQLPPFTVTSSCGNRPPESNGSVRLSDGLTVHYGFLATERSRFDNGSSCVISIGVIDEIDAVRGLPVATVDRTAPIDWSDSFSRYLVWREPYWKISTGSTLSLSDLLGLIER
jgi:hypothetical protein